MGLQVFGWTKARNKLFTVSACTDNLANEFLCFRDDFHLFDPAKRFHVSLEDLDLSLLFRMAKFPEGIAEWKPVSSKGPKLSKREKAGSRTKWE